jgi:hypothetical protein
VTLLEFEQRRWLRDSIAAFTANEVSQAECTQNASRRLNARLGDDAINVFNSIPSELPKLFSAKYFE